MVNVTSGSTTGESALFLYNKNDWATVIMSLMRVYQWGGISLFKRRKVAFVVSTSAWHMSSQVSRQMHNPLVNTLRIPATDPVPNIVRQLNEYQPNTLIAYASMARLLATEKLAGRLTIQPDSILTTSEVMTDESRQLVERAWGKILLDQYAATEAAGIASECEQHQGLHIFEDMLILENVDNDYRPVPVGEFGERVLVTVLFNQTVPLIRYEISDSVRLSDRQCGCGRSYRLIENVQGRAEDVLYFPSVSGGDRVPLHPIIFHEVMGFVLASGWQIIQRGNDLHILLSGARTEDHAEPLRQSMRAAVDKHGAAVENITVEVVERIPRNPNGKMSLIKREAVVSA